MKSVQKIISIIILIALLMSVVVTFSANVNAVSTSDIKAALDAKMQLSTFKPGSTPPSSLYRTGPSSGCYGFVDLLCRQIFGHNLPSIKKVETNVGTQKMELVASADFTQIGATLSNKAGNLNVSNLSDLFAKAQVGDVVQMDYTKSSGEDSLHTMMVYSVSSNGVVLYHAGSDDVYFGSESNYQTIWGFDGYELTWSKFISYLGSSDDGISIYRSNSSSVNIETNPGNNPDSTSDTDPDNYKYPDPNTTSTFYYTSPTMKDSGDNTYVSWIQAVLYQLGYAIDIDGSFGRNTEATVKQFQSDYGLEVDGRVGPATKAKLIELWNNKKAENNHTCNMDISSYQSTHPHYLVYKCSECGEEQVDTTKTQRSDSCDSCLPEKTVLNVVAGTSFEYTSFSWKSAGGADCYELIVYMNGEDKPVHWLYNLITTQYDLQLSAGEYTAYVVSINNDLIDTACWWVYSDKVSFTVSQSEETMPTEIAPFETIPTIPVSEESTEDEHIHNYYVSDSSYSTCKVYGYTVYSCECGDSYTEYEATLKEHEWLEQYDFILINERHVGFRCDYCYKCNSAKNPSVVYPDGSVKGMYTPEDFGSFDSIKELSKFFVGFFAPFDLKATLTENEKDPQIVFVWSTLDEAVSDNTTDSAKVNPVSTIDEYEATTDEAGSTVDEMISTTDEATSTEDEISYYEVSIYYNNQLIDTIRTTSTECVWSFEDGKSGYKVVITAYNADGNIVAVSDIFTVQIPSMHADWWGYYGDVDLNGKVNVKDATLIQKYLVNMEELDKHPLGQGDVNSDGAVNIKDATIIQKHSAKIEIESRIGLEYWDGYAIYNVYIEPIR